jgi:hypothetical protein
MAEQAAGGELVITHEHHASTGRRTRMRQPLRSIGACWLSSGADDGYSERLYVSGASQRHSGILESHCATTHCPSLRFPFGDDSAGRPPAQRADNRVLWETRAWRQGLVGRSPRSQRELSWDETVGRVCPSRSTLQLSPAPIRPARARTAPGAPIQQFGRRRTRPWSRTPFPGYSSLSALTGFTPAARRAGRYAAT